MYNSSFLTHIKLKQDIFSTRKLLRINPGFSMFFQVIFNQVFSADYLAHLSRRLIGELIGYSWSAVRPSSVHNANRSSPKPLGQSKPNLCRASLGRGTKVCSWHLGHMTNMAAMPKYGKNPSKIISRTGGLIFAKLGM